MYNDKSGAAMILDDLRKKAYEEYLSITQELCNRDATQEELSCCLDYMLDFAWDRDILMLYKKICSKYYYKYPECIKFYINAFREMYEDVTE